MNPTSWESWIKFYEAKGYTCHAPSYPYHEGDPTELRNNIHPNLGLVTLADVVEGLSTFIDALPEKPLLIGHSMGGFLVQKLISMDKGVAGICIDSVAPKGIMTFKWSFWKANLPVANPFKGNSPFEPSLKWFHNAFCNTMTIAETKQAYNQYVVPESRNIPRTLLKKDGVVNMKKAHKPLLFIAGEKDNIIPSSLNMKNVQAYTDKSSIVDFKEFPGRSHYICGQKNWEEVATFVNNWITALK